MNSSEERGRRPEPIGPGPGGNFRSAIFRAAGYFGFWLVLTDADSADVAAGLVAAVAATWASLRLMPAGAVEPASCQARQDSYCIFSPIDCCRNRRRIASA